ncbi:hypothetical protein [Microcoleus vaginatus]|uniref:hypothetical protein n=1 Tax=Microcoleus vaginatus TaxID=119532 RepID=UPI00403F7784
MAILVIARSFTNFLKENLLVKLGIDEGNREAIAVIIGYLIVALGVIVAIQSIGFNLASFAVVAGGLGVGIGFGIQDLTTNFVSGLTLLLDRPRESRRLRGIRRINGNRQKNLHSIDHPPNH